MPVLHALGTIIRLISRTVQGLTVGMIALTRFTSRTVLRARNRSAGGEAGMARLLDLHAASCAGDTLVTLGLAGTIFFAVPAGEARGRVAVYLLVTMLPFALVAPVVGPVLDRFRHGRRYALAVTMLGRAVLALLIAEHLDGLALYPAAFAILVLSRTYGVARSAAVPRLLPEGLGLSEAGARASVYGTFAGAVVVPVGLAATTVGPQWALRIAALIFFFGMVTALRLPPRADCDPPETVPRLLRGRGYRGVKILSGQIVIATLLGSATLRLLYGFLALHLAFAIRSESLPTELFGHDLSQQVALGLIAATLGIGSLVATAIGTRLRLRRPALLQAAGLVLVALAALAAVPGRQLVITAALCLITAVASGLGKLAVDAVIQERIPAPVRASAFAHSETTLMTAWVIGGALGLIPLPGPWGAVLGAGLATAAAVRAVAAASSLRGVKLSGVPVSEESAPQQAGGVPPRDVPQPRPERVRPAGPADRRSATQLVPGEADPATINSPGFHLYRPSRPAEDQKPAGRADPDESRS